MVAHVSCADAPAHVPDNARPSCSARVDLAGAGAGGQLVSRRGWPLSGLVLTCSSVIGKYGRSRGLRPVQRSRDSTSQLLALALVLAMLPVLGTSPRLVPVLAATRTVTNGDLRGERQPPGHDRRRVRRGHHRVRFSVTTVTLTSGALSITKDLTIKGPGPGGADHSAVVQFCDKLSRYLRELQQRRHLVALWCDDLRWFRGRL